MDKFGADVICVRGATFSSTEFYVKVENKRKLNFFGIQKPVSNGKISVYNNDILCENINVEVQSESRLISFIEDDGDQKFAPSSSILSRFQFVNGKNVVRFVSATPSFSVGCVVWLWNVSDKIIVADIDGTITKSDVWGYMETVYLGMYSYIHAGSTTLLQKLSLSGFQVMFLTSRPIHHFKDTRLFLDNAIDNTIPLPKGPLFSNREDVVKAAYREVVKHDAASFKSSVLLNILQVFYSSGANANPFTIGIGNRVTDIIAYRTVGIKNYNILYVQKNSEIIVYITPSEYSSMLKDNNVDLLETATIEEINEMKEMADRANTKVSDSDIPVSSAVVEKGGGTFTPTIHTSHVLLNDSTGKEVNDTQPSDGNDHDHDCPLHTPTPEHHSPEHHSPEHHSPEHHSLDEGRSRQKPVKRRSATNGSQDELMFKGEDLTGSTGGDFGQRFSTPTSLPPTPRGLSTIKSKSVILDSRHRNNKYSQHNMHDFGPKFPDGRDEDGDLKTISGSQTLMNGESSIASSKHMHIRTVDDLDVNEINVLPSLQKDISISGVSATSGKNDATSGKSGTSGISGTTNEDASRSTNDHNSSGDGDAPSEKKLPLPSPPSQTSHSHNKELVFKSYTDEKLFLHLARCNQDLDCIHFISSSMSLKSFVQQLAYADKNSALSSDNATDPNPANEADDIAVSIPHIASPTTHVDNDDSDSIYYNNT